MNDYRWTRQVAAHLLPLDRSWSIPNSSRLWREPWRVRGGEVGTSRWSVTWSTSDTCRLLLLQLLAPPGCSRNPIQFVGWMNKFLILRESPEPNSLGSGAWQICMETRMLCDPSEESSQFEEPVCKVSHPQINFYVLFPLFIMCSFILLVISLITF